jgi:2-hydroxy-3-oxopropionate reductase
MSSVAPPAAKDIHDRLAEKGIRMVDSPVSGGEPKAVEGTLSAMAGGSQADFEEAPPVVKKMASSAVRIGEIGAGDTAKLANQIIVAASIAAVGEALALAAKAGADPELVFRAVRGGLAGGAVLEAKAPMMLKGDFRPGFKIDLHIKDLGNVLKTGKDAGAPLPLSKVIAGIMRTLHDGGEGQLDHGALALHYERLAGVRLGG